jgi:hypothetical protein
MAPLPHDSASQLEAGQSKDLGDIYSKSSSRSGRVDNSRGPTERMPSAGRLLLTLLLSFLVTFGLAAALSPDVWHRRPCQNGDVVRQKVGEQAQDGGSFTSLLDAASPNSLHELLHKYFPERFKDGVWESDVSAVEAVRRVDAALAVSIVQLAKRADNGTTTAPPTTTPPPGSTTTSPPATTTTPPDDGSTTTEPSTTPPPPTTTPTSSPPGRTSTTPSTTGPPSPSSGTTTPGRPTTSPGTSTSTDATRPSSSSTTSSATHGPTFVTASHSGPLSTSITRGGTFAVEPCLCLLLSSVPLCLSPPFASVVVFAVS